jgi:hypothetical protein
MPKDTYKIGQKANYSLKLTGKVQKIVRSKDGLDVVHFFPLKKPRTKMVAGKRGGSPIIGPIASPLACSGFCKEFVIYRGVRYNYYACESTMGPSGITATCHYR